MVGPIRAAVCTRGPKDELGTNATGRENRHMTRYWVIAPVEAKDPEQFDKVWQFDLANNLISIGWTALGDVSKMTREELNAAFASTYPDKPPGTRGLCTRMIWDFYHEISSGDIVIARRGLKTLVAVGKVSQSAFYAPGKNPARPHPNFLGVSWQEQPRNKDFQTLAFQMRTVVELSEEKFNSVVGTPPRDPPDIEDPAFVLEKYLEEFIVSNFHAIFKGELKIYEDTEGNDGRQYDTEDVGTIDILAVESKSNSLVVIELKKGSPSDDVVGQVLRYMGWVKEKLCANGQAVKGLIICSNPDHRLSYALKVTQNVDVRYYSVSFKLRETP